MRVRHRRHQVAAVSRSVLSRQRHILSKKQRIRRILQDVNLQILADDLHGAQVRCVDGRQQDAVLVLVVTIDFRQGIYDVSKLLVLRAGEEDRLLDAYTAILFQVLG